MAKKIEFRLILLISSNGHLKWFLDSFGCIFGCIFGLAFTFGEAELSESKSELFDPDWTPLEHESSIDLAVFSSISVKVLDSFLLENVTTLPVFEFFNFDLERKSELDIDEVVNLSFPPALLLERCLRSTVPSRS